MKTIHFNGKFNNIEEINPLFSRCDIYICYPDLNRNNSFISKENIEKNLFSLKGIPIVGEYLESSDNFGGHGGKVEIKNGNVKYIDTTKAYGFVPESPEFSWEDVEEEDGTINEYLVVRGAWLWTGRYEEAKLLVGQKFGQSMEIEVFDASFVKKDGKEVYEIRDFVFSALCILGIDKDGEGHVEPAFESSSIIAYSLDKDKFKHEFNQMLKELKFSLEKSPSIEVDDNKVLQEGGKNVFEQVVEMLKKYSLEIEDLSAKSINYEEYTSIESLEEKVKEVFTQPKVEFSLTSEQLEDELRRELAEIEVITEDWWGEVYSYPRYSYVDNKLDANIVVACDSKNRYLVGFTFAQINDNVEVDEASLVRYKIDYNPMVLSGDPDPEEFEGDDGFDMVPSELVDYQLKRKEAEMKNDFASEKNALSTKIDEKDEALLQLNEKFTTLNAQLVEKDEKIQSLEQYSKDAELAKDKEKVDALFTKYSIYFKPEEIEELREKQTTFEKFELFEKEVKSIACDRLVEATKENKPLHTFVEIPKAEVEIETEDTNDVFVRLKSKLN